MILTPLQKLPKNVGDLGKLIVAKGFKKLPKVQKIAQSGHTSAELSVVGLFYECPPPFEDMRFKLDINRVTRLG